MNKLKDLYLKVFKQGIEDFKKINQIFCEDIYITDPTYLETKDEYKNEEIIEFIWNKGYEFGSKYPYPESVKKQYEVLKNKTNANTNISNLKKFIKENPDVMVYLDEHKIPRNLVDLDKYKEINYSYEDIVAIAYIEKIENNQLNLEDTILVFDTEGINEIANCKVNEYEEIYNKKMIREMNLAIKMFEKEKGEESNAQEQET